MIHIGRRVCLLVLGVLLLSWATAIGLAQSAPGLPGQTAALSGSSLAPAGAERTVADVGRANQPNTFAEPGTSHAEPSPARPSSLARAAAARTITFSYDANGRLVVANYGGKGITYGHDRAGNPIDQVVGPIAADPTPFVVYLPALFKNVRGGW